MDNHLIPPRSTSIITSSEAESQSVLPKRQAPRTMITDPATSSSTHQQTQPSLLLPPYVSTLPNKTPMDRQTKSNPAQYSVNPPSSCAKLANNHLSQHLRPPPTPYAHRTFVLPRRRLGRSSENARTRRRQRHRRRGGNRWLLATGLFRRCPVRHACFRALRWRRCRRSGKRCLRTTALLRR